MGEISIFNYEIFYLDFLDGNLSEENTTMLFSFLEQHPELKMEDDLLPTLVDETIEMSSLKKEQLKQPLFSDEINENNIEYFLIANAENLLSENEKARLSLFVSNHPVYQSTQKQFDAVYLQPNEKNVYSEKESLKKRKVFVLWPYISIAASLLFALLIWNSSQSTQIDSPPKQIAEEKVEQNDNNSEDEINTEVNEENVKIKNKNINLIAVPSPGRMMHANSVTPKVKRFTKEIIIDTLPTREIPSLNHSSQTPILITYQETELQPITKETELNPENSTLITAKIDDNMVNPIEPITAFIGEKINTTIEYKKQNRTESQPKKIFIKIGHFEFYRKKH